MAEASGNRLDGRVAVVTGSGKGIGRAEAMVMAAEGARVVVSDIGVDDGVGRAGKVAGEINHAGGHAVACTEDIATFEGARRLIQTAVDTFGGLDILLNNAGLRAANALQDFTEDQYDVVVSSHLKGSFGTIKHAAPIFIAQRSGVILNTSSESGIGHPYNIAYSCAKEGITGLTRSVARELGPYGVRCNQIRPRSGVTRKAPEFMETLRRYAPQRDALGRYGMGNRGDVSRHSLPVHVAALAVWLCTDAPAGVNGYDFFVAGDEVGLWSEPELVRSFMREGGWTLDLLDEHAPTGLVQGLTNRYLGEAIVGP